MKVTRRELGAALASAAVAAAQTPQPAGEEDLMKTARDRMKASAAALGKPAIPMSMEPAFQFKA